MTPTPEQIEAAARAIFENMSDIDGDEADWIHFRDDCEAGARAALTAAAGVGEKDKALNDAMNYGVGTMKTLEDGTQQHIRPEEMAAELDPLPKFDWTDDTEVIKLWKFIGNATIERCAQVAEDYFKQLPQFSDFYSPEQSAGKKIAAAIRALKDKP